jgi:CBS domain-containing protein
MQVKDLMVPLGEYAKVSCDASLYDALSALAEAQSRLPEGKAPHRAVLVVDTFGEVVGNIGQYVVVKALGAGSVTRKTHEEMDRAGLSPDSISTVMSHLRFFQDGLGNLQERAKSIRACDVMYPVGDSIDDNAPLQKAIERFGIGQTLSILVKRGREVVGVLRLSDLFQEIASQVLSPTNNQTED